MNLINWTPLSELDRVFERLYPSTAGMRGDAPTTKLLSPEYNWQPAANISETKDKYVIKAELPDVEKDDIHVEIHEGIITIKGEKTLKKEEDDEKQHRIESFYGRFERSFSIPSNVDETAISADSRNGVLTVSLPKQAPEEPEKPKARKISVL